VETSYRLARTRVKMNAQRVNKFELPFYEELVNVRAKRYQLLLDMYADVQRSAALMHDSEYCAWQRLLRPDEPCNCTAVHAGRLSFDGCQLPPVVPTPYLRYLERPYQLYQTTLTSGLYHFCSLLVFTVRNVVPCWHFMFMHLIVLDCYLLCHK